MAMNWWDRFWYAITHPGEPVPTIDDDETWAANEQAYRENNERDGNFLTSAAGTSGGNFLNDVTGVTAQNAFNSAEAQKQRDWSTAERLATQDYNSAEAEKARQFSLMMDSSRYARTMSDLESAGVNPMALFMSGGVGVGSAGSTSAASVSPGSGSAGSNGGNSASAVSGIIRALTTLVKAI